MGRLAEKSSHLTSWLWLHQLGKIRYCCRAEEKLVQRTNILELLESRIHMLNHLYVLREENLNVLVAEGNQEDTRSKTNMYDLSCGQINLKTCKKKEKKKKKKKKKSLRLNPPFKKKKKKKK